MKNFIAVITCLVVLAVVLPAMAQRGERGGTWDAAMLRGRIIDANNRSTQIAWYYLADSPDAKGTVPDEIARQIATLKSLADRLDKQGKGERADKLRQFIGRMQCWREVNQTITDWAGVDITGMRNQPLDQIKPGIRVRMMVTVADNAHGLPAQGTLAKNIEQVGTDTRIAYHSLPSDRKRTFFEVVGDVVSAQPLTLDINGEKMQVDTPDRFRFIARTPLTSRDLRAGQRVMTGALLGPDGRVRGMKSLLVMLDMGDFEPQPADDSEV